MPTFNELARGYAERINGAINSDGFSGRTRMSSSDLRNSRTLSELKIIKGEIDNLILSDTNKPLDEIQKRSIVEQLETELGLPVYRQKSLNITESASNDDLSDLADVVENILRGRG